jgi:hypothetical protein
MARTTGRGPPCFLTPCYEGVDGVWAMPHFFCVPLPSCTGLALPAWAAPEWMHFVGCACPSKSIVTVSYSVWTSEVVGGGGGILFVPPFHSRVKLPQVALSSLNPLSLNPRQLCMLAGPSPLLLWGQCKGVQGRAVARSCGELRTVPQCRDPTRHGNTSHPAVWAGSAV